MDISLIRTFLEVASTGSFGHASERLFVTQSAISLRVKRLEDLLGQELFVRSKAGASLTSAGEEFEGYALSLLKIWEESRQQIALPKGYTDALSIGGQYSLWPRLGFRWLDRLRKCRKDLSLKAEVGMPDRLTRYLLEGQVQIALMYTPQLRPGLTVKPVMAEELVMVASWPEPTLDTLNDRYAFVDWGPEFVQAHALHLPALTNPGLTLSTGALAGDFIQNRSLAAYLPARYVKSLVDEGALHYVADAPAFPFPIWSVWRDDLDENIARLAERELKATIKIAETDQEDVLDALEELSEDGVVETLGDFLDSEEDSE
ncbi:MULTISPECIES: LysR family transcriptional regulator [unclassified Roseivivax]|uniref:LysR family transcriptional regulator n=1 Tax=unclassified Roseivivax TaxID=2639302 RepID=UPI001268699A|nr:MULTISPECIES: LysR family transcriptional regulator [unclassified Roseivivax]QFT48853.1 HTH-type transcriptional regulator GltR [Roseivivax sp. THAF40]QFT65038.1 HTH-type transcriptional regulator GltR [Roseivivax sp. THAF30]